MNISEVLKNTSYDTSMFSDSAIKAIEDNVFLKEVRGKDVPHITCLIRKKPIRLSPEEVIRQLYIHKLINEYHYPESRISLETPVHFGREVKRADIWCSLDKIKKSYFKEFLGYCAMFDFFYKKSKFDFERFEVRWLLNFSTALLKKITENKTIKNKVRVLIVNVLQERRINDSEYRKLNKILIDYFC